MRITELVSDNNELNEALGASLAKGVGKAARGIGAVVGGAAGAWDAAKQGYAAGKSAVSGKPGTDGRTYSWDGSKWVDDQTGEPSPDQSVPPPAGTKQTASTNQSALLKQQLDAAYQQGYEHGKAQSPQQKPPAQTPGQTSQQQAIQQMKQTQQANAQAAQADNELVAAVKAAKAKPGFQQTAQDKLTIQKGAAKGIHESKKKKAVVEFQSKFLNMKI